MAAQTVAIESAVGDGIRRDTVLMASPKDSNHWQTPGTGAIHMSS
ncbi:MULTISPECIES: hypothetical protein [unclassified Leifsonia]|nr:MULTISPECIES: hypothetical protein [unclassified Leifsonia]